MSENGFWGEVDRHLVRYAGPFASTVIARAEGSFVYDTDGVPFSTSPRGR